MKILATLLLAATAVYADGPFPAPTQIPCAVTVYWYGGPSNANYGTSAAGVEVVYNVAFLNPQTALPCEAQKAAALAAGLNQTLNPGAP